MNKECEKKFLASPSFLSTARNGVHIVQGYIVISDERQLRVRVWKSGAEITLKGKREGITRDELNIKIEKDEARHLIKSLCDGKQIEKVRYLVGYNGNTWAVDEFLGQNAGLVLAEIEISSEDEEFDRPDWLGREVTNDDRYYNANLALNPYRSWCNEVEEIK